MSYGDVVLTPVIVAFVALLLLHPLYRYWLQLKRAEFIRTYPGPRGTRYVSMPSQVADDLWHEFILDIRDENFCRQAFRRRDRGGGGDGGGGCGGGGCGGGD